MEEQQYIIDYKSVDSLEFDIENPRLPHSVVDSKREEDVVDWMLKDASIIELMGSIGEKGFFPAEPLLVVLNKATNKYTVVEGNRRLTAVKLLNKPELAKRKSSSIHAIVGEAIHTPKKLPVMLFPKRKEILDYLGFKHITGVKQWSALAKAKYLKELQKEYSNSNLSINEQYKKLAKAIGSRADYVRDLLIGLDVYDIIHNKNYFEIKHLNEGSIDFGVYYNALKYANISKFLGIDKNADYPTKTIAKLNLETLTKIISEEDELGKTRLGESRNLGTLNEVILEEKAFRMFTNGKSLQESKVYLEGPHEIFKNSLFRTESSLKDAQLALKEITQCTKADVELIKNVKDQLIDIERDVTNKVQTRKRNKL